MKKNLIILLAVVAIAVLPLIFLKNASFNGADGQAKQVISQLDPNYRPWFKSIWTPPSSEVEGLMFAVQAAVGAGFLGYYFGYMRGKKAVQSKR